MASLPDIWNFKARSRFGLQEIRKLFDIMDSNLLKGPFLQHPHRLHLKWFGPRTSAP